MRDKMILVNIIKDWDWPDILRQTPLGTGIWDGVQFTLGPTDESDFVLVLNNKLKRDIVVRCDPDHVWGLMQEPYVPGCTDWMAEGLDHLAKVFTPFVPGESQKFIASQPALPWHINKSYDELMSMPMPVKDKNIAWIVGDARELPGHLDRWSFLNFLTNDGSSGIDLFGRAVRPIKDKWEGLSTYRYALAIENTSHHDYWTEKLADCFLAWTVPLYYGCTNIERYFPSDALIRIDIRKHGKCLEYIRDVVKNDDRERRLPALEEARHLVLTKYQLFPYMAQLIRGLPDKRTERENIIIPAYRRTPGARIRRVGFKTKMRLLKMAMYLRNLSGK
jgi:hypothetical protein